MKYQEVSAKELQPGSRGKRDLTIICQRAGILSVRSRASGGALVHEVPPVEETPGRAQVPAPAPRRETEPGVCGGSPQRLPQKVSASL